jgi:hypothetical protein
LAFDNHQGRAGIDHLEFFRRGVTDVEKHLCRRAALKAYNYAGIGPEDMALAQVSSTLLILRQFRSSAMRLYPGILPGSRQSRFAGR